MCKDTSMAMEASSGEKCIPKPSADAFLDEFQKCTEFPEIRAELQKCSEVDKKIEVKAPRREGERDVLGPFHYGMGWLAEDSRKFWSPPAARNGGKILELMQPYLRSEPVQSLVLEVGSGGGQHIAQFAVDLPHLLFQPTETAGHGCPNPQNPEGIGQELLFKSIMAYSDGLHNVLPPRELDASSQCWSVIEESEMPQSLSAIVVTNILHISDWTVTEGILAAAGRLLEQGKWLFIYGAFMTDSNREEQSTRDFDQSLQKSNPDWGVRDIKDLTSHAAQHGLEMVEMLSMPFGNWGVVFARL